MDNSYEMMQHTNAMREHSKSLQNHYVSLISHGNKMEHSSQSMHMLSSSLDKHTQTMWDLKKVLEAFGNNINGIKHLVDRMDASTFEMHQLSMNLELNALTNICANKDMPEHIRKIAADTIIEYMEKSYQTPNSSVQKQTK